MRAWLVRVIVVAIAAALGCVAALVHAPSATSHTGGEAVPHVQEFRLVPRGGQAWEVHLTLVDFDSGDPIIGAETTLRGASGGASFGPVTLTETGGGKYTGAIAAAAGEWSFDLAAQDRPGADELRPFSELYTVELVEGEDIVVDSSSEGAFWWILLAVVAGIVAVTVALWLWVRVRNARRAGESSR